MDEGQKYAWVNFYRELAWKLLDFKNDHAGLVSIVKQVYANTGINMPKMDRDGVLFDIDPFTFFGIFNRGISQVNRIKIASELARILNITSPVPTSFDAIPVLNNQNATYYIFAGDRADNDIDDFWNFFEAALRYASDKSEENRNSFCRLFDLAIAKKYCGNGKITMGLFWINADTYLNLDSRNMWYVYRSGKLPAELVESLPRIEGRLTGATYLDLLDKISAYLTSEQSGFASFKELSEDAWYCSKEKIDKDGSLEAEGSIGEETLGDVVEEISSEYPDYSREDFLSEVFMSEDSYNKLVSLLRHKKNIILEGAPGVGKTFAARRLAYSMLGEKAKERVMMVQFHQSYSYEDFIEGYRPSEDGSGFERRAGVFYNFCKMASEDLDNDYFFIIDEINRGNLSKIFGELFMLIEADKRGASLQLLYSGEKFSVPKNVYIIGMMNTADRSLAMLDYALRRRFAFFRMEPGFDSEGFKQYQEQLSSEKFDRLIAVIKQLNGAIADDEALGKGFCIGHSFFCNLPDASDEKLLSIIDFEIVPLLNEYWFDDSAKANEWAEKLKNALK